MSREAGVRYFSSPFDNIDTVEGLEEVGQLLASRFNSYFDDIDQWEIKNQYVKDTDEVLTKIIWHKDSPNVYYPHFNERWLSGEGMNVEELKEWKQSKALDILPIFDDIKKLFSIRQQRLISLLEKGVDMLFVRVDERRSLRRIPAANDDRTLSNFIDLIKKSYPESNIKLLYFYCDSDVARELHSSEDIECILIPKGNGDEDDRQFVINKLKELKLKPREKLLEYGITDSHR